MALWRRLIALVAAAAIVASPDLGCASFCPNSADGIAQTANPPAANSDDFMAVSAAMPEDCAAAMKGQAAKEAPSHDPDCQGCSDCSAMPSVKTPALAHAGAVTVDAPVIVTLNVFVSPIANFHAQGRQRLTPPANGPPLHATPVTLKNNLRI